MRDRTWKALAAAAVAAVFYTGWNIGELARTRGASAGAAQAQTARIPTAGGYRELIVTSSADGRRIYLWNPEPALGQVLLPQAPVFLGSTSIDEQQQPAPKSKRR